MCKQKESHLKTILKNIGKGIMSGMTMRGAVQTQIFMEKYT
jgi:hypothetical protein